jgi:transcription initiation factor TFIIB
MSPWDQINLLRAKTLSNLQAIDLNEPIKPTINNDRNNNKDEFPEKSDIQINSEEKYNKELLNNLTTANTECPGCFIGVLVSNSKSGYDECDTCEYTDTIIISDGPEYHNYSDNTGPDKTRCGAPSDPLLPKSSMSTIMSGNNLNCIRRIHNWTRMPHHERTLYNTFKKMKCKIEKSNLMGLVMADAKYYYKIIHDKDDGYVLTRGNNRKGVIAACVLYSCNQRNIARTDLDIAEIFDIDLKVMTKGCKKFREIMWGKGYKIYFDPISPLRYIERFCNIAGVSDEHMEIGKYIAYRCCKLGISDNNTPLSISGGILYTLGILFDYKITKETLYSICTTSAVTLNKFFKKVIMYRTHILPKKEIAKIKYLVMLDVADFHQHYKTQLPDNGTKIFIRKMKAEKLPNIQTFIDYINRYIDLT